MSHTYGVRCLVLRLTAGAGAAIGAPLEVRIPDGNTGNFTSLFANWEHSHGDRGGVTAAAALGRRDALPAVAARLDRERLAASLARDFSDDQPRSVIEDLDAKVGSALRT